MILKAYDHRKKTQVVAGKFDLVNTTFTKKVKPGHYMVKEGGYGISEELVTHLSRLNCTKVKIVSKLKTFEIGFEDVIKLPVKDYGHGEQRFIKAEK
jgi:hypothetical protein